MLHITHAVPSKTPSAADLETNKVSCKEREVLREGKGEGQGEGEGEGEGLNFL